MSKSTTKTVKSAADKTKKPEELKKEETKTTDTPVVKKSSQTSIEPTGSTETSQTTVGSEKEKEGLKSKEIASKKESTSKEEKEEKENIQKFNKENSLKVKGYNLSRGGSFRKVKSKITLEDLVSKQNLPEESNFDSEFILENGQIFNHKDGLTTENRKGELNGI